MGFEKYVKLKNPIQNIVHTILLDTRNKTVEHGKDFKETMANARNAQ